MRPNKKRWLIVVGILVMAIIGGSAAISGTSVLQDTARRITDAICGRAPGQSSSVASFTQTVNLNPNGSYVSAASDAPALDFTIFRKGIYTQFDYKRAERESNLSKVDAVSVAQGLSLRERQLVLEVVMQESKGLNLPYGDKDSVGLFQQRAGWGTVSQRMNIEYATNAFIDAMRRTKSKKNLATDPIKELAIDIQVPDRQYYDRDWLDYKWDTLGASLVGSTEYTGDASADLLDSEVTFGDDSGSGDCIPASCYTGSYSPVDSLRIATWNREYGNSGSQFRQGLLTLSKQADIINLQEMGDGNWSVATSLFAKQGFGTVERRYRNAVPIYYNKAKFKYLDSGEDRPARGTRVESGAGGRYFSNKNVTWLKLRVKSTGAVVIMINQHLVPSYESGGRLDRDKPLRIALYNKQMSALNDLVNDFKPEGLVYASADWNYAAEKDEKIKSKDGVRAKLESMGLFMNWRSLGFGKFKSTHASGRFIDGIAGFVTKAAKPVAQVVLSSFGSDHKAVIVTYKGEATKEATPEGAKADPVLLSNTNPQSQSSTPPSQAPSPAPTTSPSDPQANPDQPQEAPNDPACEGQEGNSGGGNPLSGKCLTKKINVDGESLLPTKALWYNTRLVAQCAAGYFKGISPTTYVKGADQNHLSGKAVDLMVANWETAEGKANGWKLARWLKDNATDLGIEYIIFDRQIWSVPRAKEGWRKCGTAAAKCYGGTNASAAHLNHVHVDTYPGKAEGLGSGNTADTSGWGLPLKKKYAVSSKFGMRTHPKTGVYKLHDGSDFGVGVGTPVIAPADGTVKSVSYNAYTGKTLSISHAGGKVTTTFAHLSSITVQRGDTVKRGQIIAYSGNTGEYTTGAHLHTSVQVEGYVNPDCAKRPLGICNGARNWVDAAEFYTSSDYRAQFVKYAPLLGKQDFGLAA